MKNNLEVKKLLFKVGLLSLPFVISFAVELYILPIDFFTLRPWETLTVKSLKVMNGPFYPNQEVKQIATGEIAPHSPYAVPKPEYWVTDKYGYRNRNINNSPEVVLIGDSFVAGATLSQENILSEALKRRINQEVYSFAAATPDILSKFLLNKRFQKTPPKTIVFCRSERWVYNSPSIHDQSIKDVWQAKIGHVVNDNLALANLVVTLDRIAKWPMYHYFRAKLDRHFKKPEFNLYQGELFLYGESVNNEVPEKEIKRIGNIIEEYSNVLKEKGIRFIFMPVPNKENIYYQLLPSQQRANFLPRLFADLEARGVEVINLQEPFKHAYYNQKLLLYPKDDNHWNKNGVNIAANLLYNKLVLSHNKSIAVKHNQNKN